MLAHLAALDRLTAGNSTTPRARLEAKLGPELTRLVLGSVGAGPARRQVATH